MRQYPFPENRTNKFLFALFLVAMLYLARDTLLTSCVVGFVKSQVLMLGLMGALGVVFLIFNRRSWREILLDQRGPLMGLCAALLLLPMVFKRDWQMMYFSVLLCLVFPIFLTYFLDSRRVARCYVLIFTAVGLYSLLATYVLRRLPDGGVMQVPVFYNSEGIGFYDFGLSYVAVSYDKNRNFGIFREPGVYQYFVMLALVANSYLVDWDKQWKLWLVNGLLAAVMLSTLATGGYAGMAVLAVVLFFDKKLYRYKAAVALVLAGVIGAVALVLWSFQKQNMLWWEIYAMTVSKFGPEGTSVTDRTGSIFINMGYFLRSPLAGARVAEVLHALENNTSSTTVMLAIFGLGGGALHLAGWGALVHSTGRKLITRLALFLILLMSFNTQNLSADLFLWLLPMMALTEEIGKGRKS